MFSSSFSLETEVDNCPERMDAAVGFWSGMGVETAVRTTMLSAVDICPERVYLAALYRF